jgi:hypothetical protein
VAGCAVPAWQCWLMGRCVCARLFAAVQGRTVVEQSLEVDGRKWAMTCVSMGNPHAITYSVDGQPIKVCVARLFHWAGGVSFCLVKTE